MTIQLKATVQYFPVVLLIIQYKVVLTLESVDVILKLCDHSTEKRDKYFPRVLLGNFFES